MASETRLALPPRVGEATAVEGIAAVQAELWDGILAPGQRPIAHRHLAAWEHAELAGFRSRPLVVRDGSGETLLAAAPGYFYDLDLASTQPLVVRGVVARLRCAVPRLFLQHVYEVGTPTPLVPPVLRNGAVGYPEALAAIVRGALREAEASGAGMVLAQSFQHTTGRVADVFHALGFRPVPIPPTVVVQLPFDTFDEYLSSMWAQYRRRARRVFELSSHLRVEHARGFVELAPELARLWRLVFDRAHELRREVLPSPFFRDIAAIEDTSLLVLRRPRGSIASYALLLEDDPCLHFLYTGFETRARDEGACFRLLYEIVRTAIDRGFTQANLGLTTLEPKLDVGGVPVPLFAWLHHHREPVGRLLAHLGSGVFAPDPARPRSVFKA